MKITECECPKPGWCARHQCLKTPVLHWLCRHDPARFAEWERGEGLRLDLAPPAGAVPPAMPGMLQRTVNFGQAWIEHARNGFQPVADAEYERRIAICRTCSYCDVAALICCHAACGCHLIWKARWSSAVCPLAKWSESSMPVE